MRGTTEYSPPRWMLARNRSFVSWSVVWSITFSFQRLARIEATAGLQISQPCPLPWLLIRAVERLDPLDLDDLEQFLPRVGEVLAEVVVHLLAQRRQFGLEQVGDQRHAAAAASAGPGAVLDLGQRGEAAVADGLADLELG